MSAEEQTMLKVALARKFLQWTGVDKANRWNILVRKPVYGEDTRNAIKITLLFGDLFDVKKHKNLDRYSYYDSNAQL